MRILGMKPGHDGAVALIEDGNLVFSLEGEKDSFRRNGGVSPSLLIQAAAMSPGPPDMIALGGWNKHQTRYNQSAVGAGYIGLAASEVRDSRFFGHAVKVFSSSHERSHLLMSAAMAPGAPLEDAVFLVWEGVVGAFYIWSRYGANIERLHVLSEPGGRFASLFALADPKFPDRGAIPRLEDAGKLMALAGFGCSDDVGSDGQRAVQAILAAETVYPLDKFRFSGSPFYNCGVDAKILHDGARYLSDKLFDVFLQVAIREIPSDLPLLISGGCGLNCDWNTRWVESGIFRRVFVAPCTNDSGSAIGTAMDAAVFMGAPCSLSWDVFSGADFQHDLLPSPLHWRREPLDMAAVAASLASGAIVPWVQGRYEIGPRALGHRSLLASPLASRNKDRLNEIKGREAYRPIAPCCLAEELDEWFETAIDDPHMLYFSRVKSSRLPAVTHVDGTSRLQSVHEEADPILYQLLRECRQRFGAGVLCNTSLNFRGSGFINSMSDLIVFCESRGIDQFVVGDVHYCRA